MSLIDELDLDLAEIPRVGPGRQPAQVEAEFVRELTLADLAMPVVQIQTAPSIKKLKDTHHALARVLASGAGEAEASAITGYSPSRISILKGDPQFQGLLEFYRSKAIDTTGVFAQRMADVGMSALAELADRLEEEPEKISTGVLKEIVTGLADRTGHAPAKGGPGGSVTVNIGLSDKMAEARARVDRSRKTIDITPKE